MKKCFQDVAKWTAALALCSALSSCGGGSGSPSVPTTPVVAGTIAYKAQNRNALMNADGTQKRGTDGFGFIDFSPSGQEILQACGTSTGDGGFNSALCIYGLDGTVHKKLEPLDPGRGYRSGLWSPDGKKLAFVAADELYVIDADGSNLVQLASAGVVDYGYAWRPDGSRIVFFIGEKGLFTVAPDGSDKQEATARIDVSIRGLRLAWSSGGQNIVVSATSDAASFSLFSSRIFIVNADGSETKRVIEGNNANARYSRDGKTLGFVSLRDGVRRVYLAQADGSNPVAVANTEGAISFDFSPDGQSIAFASDVSGNSEIYRIKRDGSERTNLTNNPQEDSRPVWSPR